jgi:mRNA interferase HigB
MEVVNRGVLDRASRKHADLRASMRRWIDIVAAAEWTNLDDVRRTFPSADGVPFDSGAVATVFNVGGNNYRIITVIFYPEQRVYVVLVTTHAEYDKNRWKTKL